MKYLYNIIIKGILTIKRAIIQQSTMCKFKHISWSYMDTYDMCSLGFSCAFSVSHIFNSLNDIYSIRELHCVIGVMTGYRLDSIRFELRYLSDFCICPFSSLNPSSFLYIE